MYKKYLSSICFLLSSIALQAQDDTHVFGFLQLPASSHAAALGGENISVIEDDINLATHNPALLASASDKTLALNYMHYIEGVNVAGAAFARIAGERTTWAVTARYVDYGELTQTTEENIELGEFSAKDIALSGIYTYNLSDYWSGGVSANLLYSRYHQSSSIAVGVDLGVNYYREEQDLSFSLVVRNLGGQLKAFEERRESLPVNLQAGLTKRLAHAPVRLSVTLHDLTHWSSATTRANHFGRKLLNHVALGIDFIPTRTFYLAAGYNFRRGDEMKINGSSHWAGFTCGTGIQLKRLKLGLAYAKYHVSASSLVCNLAYRL
ncbi:MAG: type IX secretion system protein PorQ [Prevotellaceae bacterium]|nr:type IX secretion system protein PorQ [Prevotellaceae bacterium]